MFGHSGQGSRRAAAVGRTRRDLELPHARGALAVGGAEAVGAGVAAAEDDHALAASRRASRRRPTVVAGDDAVLLLEVRHREVHAREVAPGTSSGARLRGADGEAHGVEVLAELLARDRAADVDAGAELDALGRHLLEPAIEQALLHLEVGDAVAEQAADAVGALEQRRRRGPARASCCAAARPAGPGADDGDLLAGALRGRLGHDPALLEGVVDDRRPRPA